MEQAIPVRSPAQGKTTRGNEAEDPEQYQLFETSQYKYRVFVTDMSDPIYFVVWFYGQRAAPKT